MSLSNEEQNVSNHYFVERAIEAGGISPASKI
jgi:hypothetical protein